MARIQSAIFKPWMKHSLDTKHHYLNRKKGAIWNGDWTQM